MVPPVLQQQQQLKSGALVGPPPSLCVYPYRTASFTQQQRHKVLLLKRRVRVLQDSLLQGAGGADELHNAASSCAAAPPAGKAPTDAAAKAATAKEKLTSQLASPLTGFEVNWIIDDATLKRYLVARDWNVSKAFALLLETVRFRRQMKPERIKPKSVMHCDPQGAVYRRGFDRKNNPIIYFRPGKSQLPASADADDSIKLLIYTLERACQSMHRQGGTAAITFVVDYRGCTTADQLPFSIALRFIDVLQNHYPERLARAFIVNVPWYFSTFWNCIKPFLPSRTVQKIVYVSTAEPKSLEPLFEWIAPEAVESWIPGGAATSTYDHAVYWAAEMQQFEQMMKFLQQEFICKTQQQRVQEAKMFYELRAGGMSEAAAMHETRRRFSRLPGVLPEGAPGGANTGNTAAASPCAERKAGGKDAGPAAAPEPAASAAGGVGGGLMLEKEEEEILENLGEEEDDEKEEGTLNEDEEKHRLLQRALEKAREGVSLEEVQRDAAAAAATKPAAAAPS